MEAIEILKLMIRSAKQFVALGEKAVRKAEDKEIRPKGSDLKK